MAASPFQFKRILSFAAGAFAAAVLFNQLDRRLMNGQEALKYMEDLSMPLKAVLGDLGLLK